MKKLALVLGSLLVVGSVASAKEIMPAPTPAPEVMVKVVEKPVIVYKDRVVEDTKWKPNGSLDTQYRWYGETENRVHGDEKAGSKYANKDMANAGRMQIQAGINFTENQRLEIRERTFNKLQSKESYAKADNLRLRHFYNFGTLADTKIGAKSRLEYSTKHGDGAKHVEASVGLDFSDYLFSNDYIKTDSFVLRPLYKYSWNRDEKKGNDYTNTLGLNLESTYSLPYGFSIEFNLYSKYEMAKDKYNTTKGMKDKEFKTDMELYLYNSTELYKYENIALSFNFEGGYDAYTYRQYKIGAKGTNDSTGDRLDYSLYALPTLQANYQATEYVNLYAAIGAEYRNWAETAQKTASHWRWQPTAWAGMKVTF